MLVCSRDGSVYSFDLVKILNFCYSCAALIMTLFTDCRIHPMLTGHSPYQLCTISGRSSFSVFKVLEDQILAVLSNCQKKFLNLYLFLICLIFLKIHLHISRSWVLFLLQEYMYSAFNLKLQCWVLLGCWIHTIKVAFFIYLVDIN